MALQCDKPDYVLTGEDKSEINAAFSKGMLDVSLDRDEGTITASYDDYNGQVDAYFLWADRDGDEDEYYLESWVLHELIKPTTYVDKTGRHEI